MRRIINVPELKKIQLDILKAVDEFCKKNGIEYFLFVGTLLGAVRHKGYIPWDDDIDICMKRKDYDRFFELFNADRNDSLFAMDFKNTPDYYLVFGKVINTATVIDEYNNFEKKIGIYIDVFPLDDLPTNLTKVHLLDLRLMPYRKMVLLKTIRATNMRKWYKNALLKVGEFLLRAISLHWILRRITKLSTMYNEKTDCENIADIAVFTYGYKELFPKRYFEGNSELEFEGLKFKGPIDYEKVLKTLYGDYMQLPPKEKRVSHHRYEAYWKNEHEL